MATLPKLVNVADLNEQNSDFKLLHFTKAQWKKAIGGIAISPSTGIPKTGVFLIAIPDPTGAVTIAPACNSGPDSICHVKPKFVPGAGPGAGMVLQCFCKPPGSTAQPSPPSCVMRIIAGRITCDGGTCAVGNCRLVIVQTGGIFRLFCRCG